MLVLGGLAREIEYDISLYQLSSIGVWRTALSFQGQRSVYRVWLTANVPAGQSPFLPKLAARCLLSAIESGLVVQTHATPAALVHPSGQ